MPSHLCVLDPRLAGASLRVCVLDLLDLAPPRAHPGRGTDHLMADFEIGSEFAGHRIDGIAGRGGMGVVYLATHLALNRRVALKLIAPDLAQDEGFRERFKQESMTAASIDHPHVIPIYRSEERRVGKECRS